MRLLLVPHAPTAWNAEERLQGQTDTPLSEVGRRQAALLAERLSGEKIHAVFTSDLRRARDTAAAVAGPHGLTINPEPRLRELSFGAWEGVTVQESWRADPEAALAWHTDPWWQAPPGGETLGQVAERVGAFLAALTGEGREKGRTVLLVAHRGSLRVLLCQALGLSARSWWQFRLDPASLSELDLYTEGAVVNRLNDTHHLREASHAG